MEQKQWNPADLLQLSGGYWSACALHAGVKLDLFTPLAERAHTALELAGMLDADPRGLAMLLSALAALNLLEKTGATFAATPFAAEYLARNSPKYVGHIIRHHHHLMASWAHLDVAVEKGGPIRERVSHDDDEAARESFLMGMFNLAMLIAPKIVSQVDLAGRCRLLDLGGGPGTYGITGRFDVAWLSHILHGEGPEGCAVILAKAVAALEPGGVVLVQEFILDDTRDGPLFPALFSLNMLLGTSSGQAYSQGELFAMLAAAGIGDLRRVPLELPNGAGVIAGTVPG